jgi:hypothetical protein
MASGDVGAFAQDLLTRIYNVHWKTGLAVEFTGSLDEGTGSPARSPSYLALNRPLSLNKVTISFWFRIPLKVANAKALADEGKPIWDFTVLYNCIPLLMFGQQQTGAIYHWTDDKPIGELPNYDLEGNYDPIPVYGTGVTGSHVAPMQPSCIGVTFGKDSSEGGLIVHIQTADMAIAENLAVEDSEIILDGGTGPGYTVVTQDASYAMTAGAEALGNQGSINLGVYGGNIAPAIQADQWHHILISWDLQASNATHGSEEGSTTAGGTESYSLMWCAIDDVNKDKYELPANWIGGSGAGAAEEPSTNPNAHLSNLAYRYSGVGDDPPPRVKVDFSPIPSNPLIIPAPTTLLYPTGPQGETGEVKANQLVEMAELQIFTDVVVNTSEEIKRRAFIDFARDENGNPIADADGKFALKPVDPKKAEELMGKKPEVLLHGSGNWIEGYNTGSTGVLIDGDKIPTGQFTPTGVINQYTPDPSVTVDH